jgi:hypothetical protein
MMDAVAKGSDSSTGSGGEIPCGFHRLLWIIGGMCEFLAVIGLSDGVD